MRSTRPAQLHVLYSNLYYNILLRLQTTRLPIGEFPPTSERTLPTTENQKLEDTETYSRASGITPEEINVMVLQLADRSITVSELCHYRWRLCIYYTFNRILKWRVHIYAKSFCLPRYNIIQKYKI
jgi:hypothetical protein